MSVARRRFRFIKEIAEGGFGKVYLAEQLSQDGFSRIVAVKLLHAKWSSHDEVVMRTRDEARLLGLIRHQNIVKVEDLSSIDGKCAIVMEYLEGVDLKGMAAFLTERGVDFPRAALFEIMLSVASALDAAYNGRPLQGGEPLRVLHRDIKPSNVFLTVAGQIKLLDFGTARANFAEREAKTQALAFGSQGYMAPERMLGEEDTPAADVFSLGVTLYEMLSLENFGRIPPRPNKFVAKVEERVASLPLNTDPDWDDQVRDTLSLMLSYEPGDRPTAAQLVDIFELLSQTAGDMALRRFCRTIVAEAKANEPELETGDPLTGTVVDEDESSAFGMTAGGVPQAAAPPDTTDPFGGAPPPAGAGIGLAPPPGATRDPTPAPAPVIQQAPTPAPAPVAPAPAGPVVDDYEEEPAKGGMGKIVLAVVAVLVVVGIIVVVVGGGAAAFFIAGPGGSANGPDTPEPTPVETPAEPEFTGSVVNTDDTRTDVKRSPTVLTTTEPGEIKKIKITGLGFDFDAEWDGKGEFDLGEVGEGTYRTIVTPSTGSTIRNKNFKVVGRSRGCAFAFDLTAKAWQGECQ